MAGLTAAELAVELKRWNALIWRTAKQLARRFPGVDVDDIAGEVGLAWVEAGRRFDPARGVMFNSYANKRGYWQGKKFCLREKFRDLAGVDHDGHTAFPRYAALCYDREDGRGVRGDLLPDRRPASPEWSSPTWWEEVLAGLPPDEAKALELFYRHEVSVVNIAARMGKDRDRVRELIGRGLARLRKDRPGLEALVAG